MTTPQSLTLKSPAKINVFLEVLGKRPDGFHELETVMLRTDLCDTLTFEATTSDDLTLALHPESVGVDHFPLDESNLISKAAMALREATGCALGIAISVQKQIPAEAGLAGGSSNAATTLLALNRMWKLDLPLSQLHEIAASLGSDINFFLEDCEAAVCRGRGERVSPIPVRGSFHFVAVRPSKGNSTPDIFSQLEHVSAPCHCDDVVRALADGDAQQLERVVFNRLTTAAQKVNPEMADLMRELSEMMDRPIVMSGSGSTCFVVCENARDAFETESLLAANGAVRLTVDGGR